MIFETQLPDNFQRLIDEQVSKYEKEIVIEERYSIPNTDQIQTEQTNKWIKIPYVTCVFVDMKNSTKFSASHHPTTTAKFYSLFTGTAVRLFNEFSSSYVDVKGDGVFALFNIDQAHTALAAAVTFNTFVSETFTPLVESITDIETGCHIGIAQSTLLVKKIGLRRSDSRSDMHNEVWAGKAVNFAAKLSSLPHTNGIYVSPTFFYDIIARKALYSCECGGVSKYLWEEIDLTNDDRFPFNKAHLLKSHWCKLHGAEYLSEIIEHDS